LLKQDGIRAEWEYPFAVAGINISFMLVQMLDLQAGNMNSLDKFSGINDYTHESSTLDEIWSKNDFISEKHSLSRTLVLLQ